MKSPFGFGMVGEEGCVGIAIAIICDDKYPTCGYPKLLPDPHHREEFHVLQRDIVGEIMGGEGRVGGDVVAGVDNCFT